MTTMQIRTLVLCAGAAAAVANAQPVNTVLPGGGWSWQPIGGGTYDTGTVGTKRGGSNGQLVGPFNDTSFGIMDEPNTPWFDDSDLSGQQYVQSQIFGNIGTNGAPGFRNFNTGYQGTLAGTNFPNSTNERRSVTLNHWNNPNPDVGGLATFGQVVFVPVSARFTGGIGFGADEMTVRIIGGVGGGTSKFDINSRIDASWSTTALGGITNANNRIQMLSATQLFDPGPGFGFYDAPIGYGVALGAGQIDIFRAGSVFDQGVNIGGTGQGIPVNSVGVGLSDDYNVLSSILQNGSAFTITYDASAQVSLSRVFGNADARANIGPGFEGTARLVVEWQAFRAIPTPGAAAVLGLAALAAGRRRR